MKIEIYEDDSNQEELLRKLINIGLNKITELNITRSPNMLFIPFLPNLIDLDCSFSNIEHIEELDNVKYLNIISCEKLQKISKSYSKLVILNGMYCSLYDLPICQNLEELYISNSPNILEIPHFPNLKILECEHTNVVYIPFMEKLEELNISLCPNLLEIPNFPNLKELIIKKSIIVNLTKYLKLEKLEILEVLDIKDLLQIFNNDHKKIKDVHEKNNDLEVYFDDEKIEWKKIFLKLSKYNKHV